MTLYEIPSSSIHLFIIITLEFRYFEKKKWNWSRKRLHIHLQNTEIHSESIGNSTIVIFYTLFHKNENNFSVYLRQKKIKQKIMQNRNETTKNLSNKHHIFMFNIDEFSIEITAKNKRSRAHTTCNWKDFVIVTNVQVATVSSVCLTGNVYSHTVTIRMLWRSIYVYTKYKNTEIKIKIKKN